MASIIPYVWGTTTLTGTHSQRAGPEWLWRLARETTASAKDITYTPRQKINDATGRLEMAVSAKEEEDWA